MLPAMSCRVLVAALCAVVIGCGSDPVDKPDPSGSPVPSGTGDCKGPGYREDGESQQVDSVTAELVDLDGEPVSDELVQVCGLDLCTNGKSGRDGRVSMALGNEFLEPAFKFGEGRVSARFAQLLPREPELELGVVRTVRLPDVTTSVPLVAGETAEYDGLSLTIADDAEVQIDGISFRTDAEKGLRAVRVPVESAPDVVGEGPGLELVYAATPVETHFCPPAALSVENSEGWAPGTDVEVWLHGVDIAEEFAPYGGWGLVSAAKVSADGERIETTAPGLPVLGVLGFRRAD
jgi:hypothetical protein